MNIQQAKDITKAVIEFNIEAKANGTKPSKLVNPQLIGDPGIGKTSVIEQAAEELGIECRTVIIAQYDSSEIGGMPYLNEDEEGNKQYSRARPDWLPSEGTGVLFIDELSQAPMANLNLVAQLANEHRIGEHVLGEGWTLAFANNKLTNRAGTNAIPTHLKDRLMPLEVEANLDDTINRFNVTQTNSKIISFLRMFPQRLAEFDSTKDVCPSPRSYERLNTLLSMHEKGILSAASLNHCIASTIGLGAANDFVTHLELHDKMVNPDEVISDPHNAPLPENVNVSYVLCAALAARAKESNIGKILSYAERLTHQDQVVFLIKDALMRTGAKESPLLKDKDMKKYLQTSGRDLVL